MNPDLTSATPDTPEVSEQLQLFNAREADAYIRNTRPHLYWLGFAEKPGDTKPLETDNYDKCWQVMHDYTGQSINS